MRPLVILVTGASGLIGGEVAGRLAADGHAVIALVHSDPNLMRHNGRPLRTEAGATAPVAGSAIRITGDVTRPRLGLTAGQYTMIQSTVERIVHCAAITEFGRDQRRYEAVNVTGTGHVLELARARQIPLVHVSTAYVCGERTGEIAEDELAAGQRFGIPYEASKFRAEQMVNAMRAAGLPAAVVRPSIVVGAERTGAIREFRNIYVVLKTLTEGRVRSIPGHYDATLDLVPVDYAAEVIVAAATRFEEAEGGTFHAVGAAPHTLRDFSDVLAEYPSFRVPRYIPPSAFSAGRFGPLERSYYERIVSLYESYFRRRMVFASDAAVGLVGRRPATRGKPYLRKLLDYGLRAGYFGAPLPSVADVLGQLQPAARRGGG